LKQAVTKDNKTFSRQITADFTKLKQEVTRDHAAFGDRVRKNFEDFKKEVREADQMFVNRTQKIVAATGPRVTALETNTKSLTEALATAGARIASGRVEFARDFRVEFEGIIEG
jgi:uridine kinase